MARFVSVPGIPEQELSDTTSILVSAVKQNVELLAGLRGEEDSSSRAVLRGDIGVEQMATQDMRQVTAKGNGFTISGQEVVALEDYVKLVTDVQTLANDLAYTRAVLNALIKQIKG